MTMCMTSYPDLWDTHPRKLRTPPRWTNPAHPGTISAMSDEPRALEPMPQDDVLALQPVVRSYSAAKLKALIERLEPEVDGSYGPVNPRMVEVYMKALDQLTKLYRGYDPPPPRDEKPPEQRRAEQLRAVVEQQLADLAARAQISG